jgi:hypothetical protein
MADLSLDCRARLLQPQSTAAASFSSPSPFARASLMSTTAAATTKRSKLTTIILGVAISAIVVLVLFLFTVMFGNVTGTEFAAHNFKSRNYHVLRIPLINIQVWPAQRVDESSTLVEHLFGKEKILTEVKPADPEFDLVEELAGARAIKGDARFLQYYLTDQSSAEWLDWTKDHAELAKVFWPEVQKMASRKMYAAIPEMFHLAKESESADALKAALHKHIAQHYVLIGQAEYEQGEIGPAIVLLEEAKAYAPQDAELDKLLTEVKSKAEKKEKSG